MRQLTARDALTALLISMFLACSVGRAQPTTQELIQHVADNEKKLHNLYVDGEMWFEKQTAAGKWERTPLMSHAILWSDGQPGGKARVDILKQVSYWANKPNEPYETSFSAAYDGKEGILLMVKDGSPGHKFGQDRATVGSGRPGMIASGSHVVGTSHFNALYQDDERGNSLSQEMTEQVKVARGVEGGYVNVNDDQYLDVKAIKLTVGKKGLVEWSWWVDPARGYALLGFRVMNTVHKPATLTSEFQNIALVKAAPDIWYPQETIILTTNKDETRPHYLVSKVVANDPKFDSAVFRLEIPKSYMVERLTKLAAKLPPEKMTPQQRLIRSAGNLRQIVQAAKLYAEEHEGKGPKTMEELKKAGLPADALTSPRPGCQYVYVGYQKEMDPLAVVAYEKCKDAEESVNIVCANDRVGLFPAAVAERMIFNGKSEKTDWR
jgi:hypothetical protein